ncbi:MAG: DUF1292 domain-containing protein [Bulleidia sp.]
MENENKNIFSPYQGQKETEDQKKAAEAVEERRITLVDNKDREYEFMVLDEYEYRGNRYLALVSVDEKDDVGNGADDQGELNDITIVRKREIGGEMQIESITDPQELLEVSRLVSADYEHLLSKEEKQD